MNIGDTISGCTVLGLAPAGDGESYILLLRQPGTRVQYVTGRVGVRQLPHPEEWWSGTYSSELEDAVKHWVKRSCIADDDPTSAVKWLTRLIENTEKVLDSLAPIATRPSSSPLIPEDVEQWPGMSVHIDKSGGEGPSVPYAVSTLDDVRVLLYRNPDNEHTSVQIETDSPVNLRVMLNDADLHEGEVQ